jgi:hypothetical protein
MKHRAMRLMIEALGPLPGTPPRSAIDNMRYCASSHDVTTHRAGTVGCKCPCVLPTAQQTDTSIMAAQSHTVAPS